MNGLELKKKREKLGLTQGQLAKLLGMSSQMVSNWETGKHEIPKTKEDRLAEIFPTNTSIGDLGRLESKIDILTEEMRQLISLVERILSVSCEEKEEKATAV